MTDTTTTRSVLSLIATSSSKVRDLVVKNGQLIFLQDVGRIALDFNNKRVFYNQIVELNTDVERLTLDSPISGYYFIIDTAVLWYYQDGWVQITEKPENILFIGTELPALGQGKENTLYINKADKEVAIFDKTSNEYVIVSDYTKEVSEEDIENLFA